LKKEFFLFFSVFSAYVNGQSFAKIEEWTSYLPYQSGLHVAQSTEFVYYSTEWSLLKINKEDFSSDRISKVEGLSDIGIRTIVFDRFNGQLVIIYNNSNIDIMSSEGIANLPNILANTDLTGDKQINVVHIADESFFYLGTGFGLVQINSRDLLFGFTTFTNIGVKDITTSNGQIYLATEEGIYFAKTDGSQNLIDFSLWDILDQDVGLPSLYSSGSIAHFRNVLFLEADNKLYSLDTGIVELVYTPPSGFRIAFLSSEGSDLMIGLSHANLAGKVIFFDGTDFLEDGAGCSDRIMGAIEDQTGRIWYADLFNGIRTAENKNSNCDRLSFDSPFSHEVSEIAIKDDRIFVASGGVRDNYDFRFTRAGYYTLKDRNWLNFNQDNSPKFKDYDLLNFLTILPHPDNNMLYVGTYWGGLLEHNLDDNTMRLFDDTNSALLGTIGDEQRERVTALAFDEESNLWVTSFGSSRPIALLNSDGEWFNFVSSMNNNLIDIVIDQFGYKWMPAFGNNGGCVVYDSGEDISSPLDDRYRFITSSNSELTTNVVNTVAVDLDGSVWLGTAEGPVVFDCGSDPFSDDCPGNRIKVIQDSIVAFLLADQDILSIAVDGANQKWFGTRNGIFVQSPDGQKEVYRFSETNSPLFDNRIRDLAYNGNSGEMVIGSDKGLQSFRTSSTTGSNIHRKSEVFVFPNPVEPHYTGPIAIKGLVRNAFVKITDINGNLVKEVRALGGQAIWDGRNLDNIPVKTGVYLIFSADDSAFDRPDSFVTKVMVIR